MRISEPGGHGRQEMTSGDTGRDAMPRAVTITGTRSTGHRPFEEYRYLFEEYLAPFALDGVQFYLGGAKGIDSLALLWLTRETRVRLTVAVPARLADQPVDARQAVAAAKDADRLDELVELGGPLATPGYHARNRWMVDRSEMVIGFPRTGTTAGGTYYTLDYAAKLDKPRMVLPV
jgi:hypothetical protein